MTRPSVNYDGMPWPMIFHPMHNYRLECNTHEEHRDMVVFLVQKAGANVWVSMQQQYAVQSEGPDAGITYAVTSQALPPSAPDEHHRLVQWSCSTSVGDLTVRLHTILPLHDAAYAGAQSLLNFYLTECHMPVDTRTPDTQLTVLHCLARSPAVKRLNSSPS